MEDCNLAGALRQLFKPVLPCGTAKPVLARQVVSQGNHGVPPVGVRRAPAGAAVQPPAALRRHHSRRLCLLATRPLVPPTLPAALPPTQARCPTAGACHKPCRCARARVACVPQACAARTVGHVEPRAVEPAERLALCVRSLLSSTAPCANLPTKCSLRPVNQPGRDREPPAGRHPHQSAPPPSRLPYPCHLDPTVNDLASAPCSRSTWLTTSCRAPSLQSSPPSRAWRS